MSIFSIRLKELRNKAKLSQQELSKVIGISKSSINMYERGEREPGLETVKAFADYFDVRTDYLLGKTDDKRSPKTGKKYNRSIIQTLEDFRLLHGYDRKQMEDFLDWEDMYSDLENDRILADAEMLTTIQNMLYTIDKRETITALIDHKKTSPEEMKFTESEIRLVLAYRSKPEMQNSVNILLGIQDQDGADIVEDMVQTIKGTKKIQI